MTRQEGTPIWLVTDICQSNQLQVMLTTRRLQHRQASWHTLTGWFSSSCSPPSQSLNAISPTPLRGR
jgi:hypothetical protein